MSSVGDQGNVGCLPLRREGGYIAELGKVLSQTVDKSETKAVRILKKRRTSFPTPTA